MSKAAQFNIAMCSRHLNEDLSVLTKESNISSPTKTPPSLAAPSQTAPSQAAPSQATIDAINGETKEEVKGDHISALL